jgi:hypothetical protein
VQSTFAFDGADNGAHGLSADSTWSTQGDLLDGNSGHHDQVAPAGGDAGLATIPDDGGSGQQQQQGMGSPMGGGMPMMGGMGAGGGGGDQERGASSWSTQGDLFDDGPSAADRINSVLDGDR